MTLFLMPCVKNLQEVGQLALVREIIALRIIEEANNGKRDPVRVSKAAPAALAVTTRHRGQLHYTPPKAA